jgi:endonuclease/exonuclease/phosphatase family metal-dependent hydrolase
MKQEQEETFASIAASAASATDGPAIHAVSDMNPWPLTVASYNIHSAVGTDGKFSPQRIAWVLREIDADVIALQEVPLGDSKRENVLALLQQVTGFHVIEGPTQRRAEKR